MKNILFASTALVAAGMMASTAHAQAQRMQLSLGGFYNMYMMFGENDGDYTRATGTDFNSLDFSNDAEIHFNGSITLDNGLKLGMRIELEGRTDGDQIDESYFTVAGGFGLVTLGSRNHVGYLMSVTAPEAVGSNELGLAHGSLGVRKPAAVFPGASFALASPNTTKILQGSGDQERISYQSPSFGGLTIGLSFTPNGTEDRTGLTTNLQGTAVGGRITQTRLNEHYTGALLYAGNLGGVGVRAAAAYQTGDATDTSKYNEWSAGMQLSMAGFTVGGSYKKVTDTIQPNATRVVSQNLNVYDLGVMYATGPWAASLYYFNSKGEATLATPGDDKIEGYQLSARYDLGPGVQYMMTIARTKFTDETPDTPANAANHNEGWAGRTGFKVAF